VTELRIPETRYKTVSGYFDDFEKLAEAAVQWSGQAAGVYFLPNVVKPALLARAANQLKTYAKYTTSDADIETRRWLFLDFDPVRPAGISSTEDEHQRALTRMQECYDWLMSLGFPSTALVCADSGNGGHILVSLDLPNDADSLALIKRCLAAVALRFSDDQVAVDLTVFNAARVWKLYGTLAGKGDSTAERPHRIAKILEAPATVTPVSRKLLEQLAALAPEETKTHARQTYNGQGVFDPLRWIAERCPDVLGPYSWGSNQKWIFPVCPWNPDHTNKAAYIVQFANGALAAGCHHNGCHGKDWHALRDLVEPGWREWGNKTGNGHAQEDPPNPDWGQDEPKKSSLTLTKLGDLLTEPEEKVAWLVDKTLPAGGFSLLVAKPKAGKSTLARNLALSVAQGRNFLGKKTQKGTVIYLALEEKRAEVKKHFQDMGATGEEDIYIHADSAPVDALQQIRAVAEEKKPVLIIIDPLFKLARVKDGNAYSEVSAALEPLLVLARKTDAHVLAVHHAGKADREAGDSILGSTAILAASDTALIMKRSERYRTISSDQRYGENLPESVLHFDPQTRTVTLGESKEREEEQRLSAAIVEFLRAKQSPTEEADIHDEVEGRKQVKVRALRRLLKDGKVFRQRKDPDLKNNRNNPYLYALALDWFTGSTSSTGSQEEETSEKDAAEFAQTSTRFTGSHQYTTTTGTSEKNTLQPSKKPHVSLVPVVPAQGKKSSLVPETAEPVEGCRYCGKPDCFLTPGGWHCKLSKEDQERWPAAENRSHSKDADGYDWQTGEQLTADDDGEVTL
jgi:hypothetical protein